jgi:aryl-alcohol dehydrogenase-like predicted oxidoreductase
MNFGGRTSPDESHPIIDAAIEAGINFLDTANVYSTGESERVVGEALKRNGHRDFIVLATKCHGNMHKAPPPPPPPPEGDASPGSEQSRLHAKLNPNQWGNSRRQIIEQCEASLRRLQTDWIDLYQIHRPHPDCAIDETLRAFDDLIRAGKVRYTGCSTFAGWQLVESLWASAKHGLNRFVTEQPPYHLLDRRIERELLPVCRTYGLGVIPWSPLAGGFLSGKYKPGQPPPEDARIQKDFHRSSMLQNQRAFEVVEEVTKLADDAGCSLSQFALSWCMHQPDITSPIIGPRTMEQLQDNLKAVEVAISDEHLKRIDELVPPGTDVVPFYEANFGASVHRF